MAETTHARSPHVHRVHRHLESLAMAAAKAAAQADSDAVAHYAANQPTTPPVPTPEGA